jgi:adenine-specific DNA-methyltransferase
LEGFKRDAELNRKRGLPEDTITDNLIIKGNNLLALHSLEKEFAGKVKLIYIDPPYNTATSANTFAYNNSFNHSSWLTFMKNRIDVARKLLTEDGFFVCAIDHYELFYLGALCDELFGRENRVGVIAVVHNPGGRQDDKFFPTAHENMLIFAKNIEMAKINTLSKSADKLRQFKLEDEFGRYKLRGFRRSGNNSNREDGPGLYYPIYYEPITGLISLNKLKNYEEILPIDDKGVEKCWRWGKDTLIEKKDKYIVVKKTKLKYEIYVKERETDYKGEKAKTFWNNAKYTGQTGTQSLKSIFGKKTFTYPKSPYLMKDVVKITTNSCDLVLDYHAGSGTTAHAIIELNKEENGNRNFILCEQLDYIDNVTVERVKKVIESEKGGFVYFELKKYNEEFMERIESAKDGKQLLKIWNDMKKRSFLNHEENLEDFKKLSIKDQKKHLAGLLDKNQLYVNLSSLNDKDFACTDEEKKLTKDFYKIKK